MKKNIIFTDTILDYVEDLEALRGMLTNRIEHEKKYGTGLNGISPPVLEIETYKDTPQQIFKIKSPNCGVYARYSQQFPSQISFPNAKKVVISLDKYLSLADGGTGEHPLADRVFSDDI